MNRKLQNSKRSGWTDSAPMGMGTPPFTGEARPRAWSSARETIAWGLATFCLFVLVGPSTNVAEASMTHQGSLLITTDTVWETDWSINGDLIVSGGATLTLRGAFTHSISGSLQVNSGATLEASGQGYPAEAGPTPGASGVTGGGGGHGGLGGLAGTHLIPADFSDSSLLPTQGGSGGGNGSFSPGGTGGGVIHFQVSGACLLDGHLNANGEDAASSVAGGVGGGGAGGTIRLSCDVLSGDGTLAANGGDGGHDLSGGCCTGNLGNGGGGGGGRIVMRAHDHAAFTGKTNSTVNGGAPGIGVGPQGEPGGRGTLAFITLSSESNPLTQFTTQSDTHLDLYQGWRWEAVAGAPFVYTEVRAHENTQIMGGREDVVLQASHLSLHNTTWDGSMRSDLQGTETVHVLIDADTVELTGSILNADLSPYDWTLNVSTLFEMTGGSLDGDSVTVTGSAALSISENTQITARTLSLEGDSLDLGGTLSVEGTGYPGGLGPGAGTSSQTQAGGGAGYGREGGDGAGSDGGPRYGATLFPLEMGSGGGHGAGASGGAGGGSLAIEMTQACTFKNATLNANGEDGAHTPDGGAGGGGSGGSLFVRCDTLTGLASLLAMGGFGGHDTDSSCCLSDNGNGGGGAGGRIALHYTSSTLDTSNVFYDGGIAFSGPGASGFMGQSGTFFEGSLPSTTWVIDGTAQGGTLTFTLLEVEISLALLSGQTANKIATRIANAIAADSRLEGITTSVNDGTLMVSAPISFPIENDSGFQIGVQTDLIIDRNVTWSTDHHILGDLSIENGSTLTLAGEHGHTVAGDLTVHAGSLISADRQGYVSGTGPESGESGPAGGGGGHGGQGGNSGSGESGGGFSGRGLLPDGLGNGGGNGTWTQGGIGGGLIRMAVSGLCSIDGSVTAHGSDGHSDARGGTGGGGAGGSISLSCHTFSGSGLLQANGGHGGEDSSSACCDSNLGTGGGGGGGRITVRARDHSSFSTKNDVRAEGGDGGGGLGPVGQSGGTGTVAFITLGIGADPLDDSLTLFDQDLELYRGWRWENSSESAFDYRLISIQPGTSVSSEGGPTHISASHFSVLDSHWPSAEDVFIEAETLEITNSILEAQSFNEDWEFDIEASSVIRQTEIEARQIHFSGDASLAFEGASELLSEKIFLSGQSLSLDGTSLFSTNGLGEPASTGDGAGGTDLAGAGGGGGHGTPGGGSAVAVGGASYGNALFPLTFGSGGGDGQYTQGGAGGGVIALQFLDQCTLEGTLTSNGSPGDTSENGGTGGGGGGGSIQITCPSLSGNGLIKAQGGEGGADLQTGGGLPDAGLGGGGAGGRVAVYTDSTLPFSSILLTGGAAGTGPGSPGNPGQAGSLVINSIQNSIWTVGGSAQGGSVSLELWGVTVVVSTFAGQTAEEVASAMAQEILLQPALLGLPVETHGATIFIQAPPVTPTLSDAGLVALEGQPPMAVPSLSRWASVALVLLLSVLAISRLRPVDPSAPATRL